jgi:hypothetical protein
VLVLDRGRGLRMLFLQAWLGMSCNKFNCLRTVLSCFSFLISSASWWQVCVPQPDFPPSFCRNILILPWLCHTGIVKGLTGVESRFVLAVIAVPLFLKQLADSTTIFAIVSEPFNSIGFFIFIIMSHVCWCWQHQSWHVHLMWSTTCVEDFAILGSLRSTFPSWFV